MTSLQIQSFERARMRYAPALYRTTLLRDPHPARAARAVIAAFKRVDWTATPLDDQLEACLVRALPPVSRWRRIHHPRKRYPGLPAHFWRLGSDARVALGLRLLRGFATPLIATALNRPLCDVQHLLIAGIALLDGQALDNLPDACQHCRTARLDDPAAERGHVVGCALCRDALPRWERAERELATQLSTVFGVLALPRVVDEALTKALLQPEAQPPSAARHRRWALQAGVVGAVGLLVLALLAGAGTSHPPKQAITSSPSLAPRQLLDAARAQYGGVAQGDGVVHRRWEISLIDRNVQFVADEWVDQSDPARYRMQLLRGVEVREWQTGDGAQVWQYASPNTRYTCGPLPTGTTQPANHINRWTLGAAEQAALRAARWHSGRWVLGLRYLERAAGAARLTSFGVTGSGAAQALTLAAEGPDINGTLLVRLDPRTYELREIREVRQNNGQTTARTAWRLIITEIIEPTQAWQQDLLGAYPNTHRPPTLRRTDAIVDPICPLITPQQTAYAPQAIMAAGGQLVGLPELPPGIDRAFVLGQPPTDNDRTFNNGVYVLPNPEALQLVYTGFGKRLMLWARIDDAPTTAEPSVEQVGPWQARLQVVVPGIWAGTLAQCASGMNGVCGSVQVWSEGWERAELLALLATARPLQLANWAEHAEQWYDGQPQNAAATAHLRHVIAAGTLRPNQTLHEIELSTVRQAPFLALLADPYHRPALPPKRRSERWIEVDAAGVVQREVQTRAGPSGELLDRVWRDASGVYRYDPQTSTVFRATVQQAMRDPHMAAVRELLTGTWTWRTLPNGDVEAERNDPIERSAFTHLLAAQQTNDAQALEPWLLRPTPGRISVRLMFGPDGRLQQRRVIGTFRYEPPDRLAMDTFFLENTLIEHSAWSPSAVTQPLGDDRQLPADVQFVTTASSQPPREISNIFSVDRANAAWVLPVWDWLTPPANVKFLFANATFRATPMVAGATIEQAVSMGQAIELHYATANGSLVLLEGPAAMLQPLLRNTPPPWTWSKPYNGTRKAPSDTVWSMGTANPNEHWAVVERDGTLLMFHHQGPEREWGELMDHHDTVQVTFTPSSPLHSLTTPAGKQ